jgi:hypothetical protein
MSATQYSIDPISALMDRFGAFFCVNDRQFESRRQKGVQYVHVGNGLVVPEEHQKALVEGLKEISEQSIDRDLRENGVTKIIRRELANYECYYTGDLTDVIEDLVRYGITADLIRAEYDATKGRADL